IEMIRAFLLGKPISDEGLSFLKSATVEQVKQELIVSREWVYDQQDSIVDIVIGQLLELGKSQGLTVSDATTLADKVCLEVAHRAATKAPEPLDFVSLRGRLDRAVNIEVPRETLRRLEQNDARINSLLSGVVPQGHALPTIADDIGVFTPPVAATNLW